MEPGPGQDACTLNAANDRAPGPGPGLSPWEGDHTARLLGGPDLLPGGRPTISRTCPPETQTQAAKRAGEAWPLSSTPRPAAQVVFSPVLISQKTELTLPLIEQFCADRREDLWQSHHHPRGCAICPARRRRAGRVCFMARLEEKPRHFYVTCCNINANLHFFQNF